MKRFVNKRKRILFLSNFLIILFIVAGFAGVVYKDTTSYQKLVETHLKSTVSLADLNISRYIENTMTKPVMVSKTMANDEFLKSWFKHEGEHLQDDAYLNQLYDYLKTYQKKYDYSSVFCVSSNSGNYYYQGGLNKVISKENDHDIWYYNFINSGKEYDIEVDTNEANNNNITMFVNFRVEDDNDNLLGIIGVGLKVSSLEEMVRSYEEDYDLSVYIINSGGAKTSFTGQTDIFINEEDLEHFTGITQSIRLSQSQNSRIQWFHSGNKLKCMITKYDSTLGWYVIVEKDTASISDIFQQRIRSNLFFMLVSLFFCIMATSTVFFSYDRLVTDTENKDELTGLSNRKLFARQYSLFIRKRRHRVKTLFMFDIDKFKDVNDTYGHLFGNTILSMVGKELATVIGDHGVAARWGGDEFLGVLDLDPENAKKLITEFMSNLKSEEKDSRYHVTISAGMVTVHEKLSLDQMIKKADAALYQSKKNGRDRITFATPE